VRKFTNLETNSALYADHLPLTFAPQPMPRAIIGEASDPDFPPAGVSTPSAGWLRLRPLRVFALWAEHALRIESLTAVLVRF
jgi:hypothetical protein